MEQSRYRDGSLDETDPFLVEKQEGSHSNTAQEERKYHPKLAWFICCLLFVTVYIVQPTQFYYGPSKQTPIVEGQIIPNEKLQWHPCRGAFYCARLTLPMDYNRPLNASKDNPKVHIALILAPGQHSSPDEYSVSPLLLNPGGPGGSGTFFATLLSHALQNIVGLDQDIIGFDPRGVQSSTPRLDCFSDPYETSDPDAQYDFGSANFLEGFYNRVSWLLAGTQIGLINSSSSALPKLDIRARTIAKLCQEKDSIRGENSIFKHAQTPNVARDMLSIIDAWDEWRDSLSSGNTDIGSNIPEPRESISGSEYSLETKGKLVYWGFSYGTLLGATFSAMFPDRVGRVILDGVIDADFYVDPIWSRSIIDSDAIISSFPKYCFEGQEKCALYRPGDSYEAIKTRFNDVQNKLRANPISFIGPNYHHPLIFTIDELKAFFFAAMYGPVQVFPWVAEAVNAILVEDYAVLEGLFASLPRESFCSAWPESNYPTDSQLSIVCGDKRYPLNETTANLQTRFEHMSNFSSFADVWLSMMMGCDGWSIDTVDPPMRWGKHPAHHEKDKPINTSFPLLFLSNTYDPVTPLNAGVKMAGLFVDSGLVEQKSMGHCSISSVSLCTMAKARAYFREGKVPAHPVKGEWERCEADEWPFHPFQGVAMDGEIKSEEMRDQSMRTASKEMQKMVVDHGFFRHGDGLGVPKLGGKNGQCGVK